MRFVNKWFVNMKKTHVTKLRVFCRGFAVTNTNYPTIRTLGNKTDQKRTGAHVESQITTNRLQEN